jgi:hypothetical protein
MGILDKLLEEEGSPPGGFDEQWKKEDILEYKEGLGSLIKVSLEARYRSGGWMAKILEVTEGSLRFVGHHIHIPSYSANARKIS